jgi:hypothetical protein
MPETPTRDDANYAIDLVRTICDEVGPGLAGSPQERARGALIAKELRSHLGAPNVAVEEFTLAPGAFMGSLPIAAVLMIGAAVFNIAGGHLGGASLWVLSLSAAAASLASVVLVCLEFVLYREVIDPLLRKKQSTNVVGTLRRPGTEIVKRVLVLSGHHDSALEIEWIGFLGYAFFAAAVSAILGLVAVFAMSVTQLMGTALGSADLVRTGTVGWGLLCYPIGPSIVFAFFFNRRARDGGTVPGAADNLSACALAVAMCRFLVRNPSYIPPDTEIRFISFGSEEAGLRGSRRYVARHFQELKRLDARLLNSEIIVHPEITILSSDIFGSAKNSRVMIRSVVAAAERAGVPCKVRAAFFGVGTDAGSFSQAGLKATTLLPFKVPRQMLAFYHQHEDGPENLTPEPFWNVMKLALEWIRHGGD